MDRRELGGGDWNLGKGLFGYWALAIPKPQGKRMRDSVWLSVCALYNGLLFRWHCLGH